MLPDMIVPTYVQMLNALSGWLAKAAAAMPDGAADALLSARLAPDMFPLSTQVRFSCVQALEGVHRLQGTPFPALVETLLNEGRDAGDNPGSIADAQARIAETVTAVQALILPDIDPETPIAHDLPMGIVFDLTAEQYVRDWTLPQFYFHLMIAYAILRAEGVALGKLDYMPHLLARVRPGTMPGQ
jgi:hypothetical protein